MTDPSAQRWQRVKEVFADVLTQADSDDELAACLANACGDDAALQAEVEALLKHHTSAEHDSFLAGAPADGSLWTSLFGTALTGGGAPLRSVEILSAPLRPPPPPQIPGYRLVRQLDEGGMGQVWLAVQEGTEQEVVVKLIRPALVDSPEVRERFEREVRLAARLKHPHIARVYDGKLGPGPPFYVMERIHGESLSRYARRRALPLEATLVLIRKVCLAVQFAHVGSSRVDLQACKLEYSIVSPK